MKTRICCLCFTLALLLSGCGADTTKATSTTTSLLSTTGSSATTTTTAETSVTDRTTLSTTLSDNTTASVSDNSIETTETASTSSITNGFGSMVTTTLVTNTTSSTATSPSTSATTTNPTVSTTTAPAIVTFTATVRNDQRQTVSGVTVSVWASDDVLIGRGVTDSKGVARITLADYPVHSYRVTLSNLPNGYEANSEYRFTSTTVNITIKKAAVQNEKDHSQAQYDEGRKMTDFSLTDIDGNTYRLSSLLSQKQLVILDFWYTTCEPCKMEFPYFESAVQKYGDKISLLAINPINDNRAMAALRQQLNASSATAVTFPMLKDTCNLYLGFDVTAYPTTVFIDANGIILDIHHGAYANEAAFLAAVERFIH